jgi:hypothetical protein
MQPANPIPHKCLIMGNLQYLEVFSNLHSGNLSRYIELVYVTPSSPVDRRCLVVIDEGIGFKSCTGYRM